MIRKALASAAFFGAALVIGGTGLASAAPAGCSTEGMVCLYRDDDYKGGSVNLQDGGVESISYLSSYGFNDQTNSWYSTYDYDAAWFYDTQFKGSRRCINSNSSNHSLSIADYDEASSAIMYNSQTAC